jgi:hypothetical protein
MLLTLLEYLSKNVEINAIRTLKLTNYALTQDKLALSKVIKEMLKVCEQFGEILILLHILYITIFKQKS